MTPATQLSPDLWRINPPSLGDTWQAGNLMAKIDHIVIVMMENRSFDHVLGYLAQLPEAENSDGLTGQLTAFLATQGFPVRGLSKSAIKPNGFGFKTQFPSGVGHELADVTKQLTGMLAPYVGAGITCGLRAVRLETRLF